MLQLQAVTLLLRRLHTELEGQKLQQPWSAACLNPISFVQTFSQRNSIIFRQCKILL